MKKISFWTIILFFSLGLFAEKIYAWETVDNNSSCWQCHQKSSNSSLNFRYGTTWHNNHMKYDSKCTKCHTNGYASKPVQTSSCANCHHATTPTPPLDGPFPCYWPENHQKAQRYTCINSLCHLNCTTEATCSTWEDVIKKYNNYVSNYVSNNATWQDVIDCYNAYVMQG